MVLSKQSATSAPRRTRAVLRGGLVRRAAVVLIAVAGWTAGGQAVAQRYAARSQGAWTVAPSSDAPGCFMTRVYAGDGATTLLFGLDADGTNHLSLLNDNWSIKPKDRMTLDFRLSGRRYAAQSAFGMTSDGKRGFVTQFPATFATELASSRFLYVDRGDVPVARLMLDGSGAALAELRRCIAAVSTESGDAPAADAAGSVPKDPFAPRAGKPSRKRR